MVNSEAQTMKISIWKVKVHRVKCLRKKQERKHKKISLNYIQILPVSN